MITVCYDFFFINFSWSSRCGPICLLLSRLFDILTSLPSSLVKTLLYFYLYVSIIGIHYLWLLPEFSLSLMYCDVLGTTCGVFGELFTLNGPHSLFNCIFVGSLLKPQSLALFEFGVHFTWGGWVMRLWPTISVILVLSE